MSTPSQRHLAPESLIGSHFKLGTFPGTILSYDEVSQQFTVKFEGTDHVQVDSATIFSVVSSHLQPPARNSTPVSRPTHNHDNEQKIGTMHTIDGYLKNSLNNIETLQHTIYRPNPLSFNLNLNHFRPPTYKKSERLRFQRHNAPKRRTTLEPNLNLHSLSLHSNIHSNVTRPLTPTPPEIAQNGLNLPKINLDRSPKMAVEADVKTDVISVIQLCYNRNRVPSIEEIETNLAKNDYIPVARLATARGRRLFTLANLDPSLVINAMVLLCPVCHTEIHLLKLCSYSMLYKHLAGHKSQGLALVSLLESIESTTSVDSPSTLSLPSPPSDPRPDRQLPLVKDLCIEAQLLVHLLEVSVLQNQSIIVQEIWLACLGILEKPAFSNDFQPLVTFQTSLKRTSQPAFEFYLAQGHPDATNLSEEGETEQDIGQLLHACVTKGALDSKAVLVQELVVLAYFYFGFITQRTPKKFQNFASLMAFFTGLYQRNSKAYEVYVGQGVTGTEFTRGRPVSSREVVKQGKYLHYGLSRKSLQRLLDSPRRASVKRKGQDHSTPRRRKSSLIISSQPLA